MSPTSGWGRTRGAGSRPHRACPCCAYTTLTAAGEGELCPVCFWEDEPLDSPDEHSELNGLSLSEARSNFRRFGAKDRESRAFVLPARERTRYATD